MHHSNIYSGAPMPYMQRITWSGVAMHAGALPGYPASHGCIRLPHEFASRIYRMTKIGQRVVISPYDIAPADIAHQNLPVPAFQSAPVQAGVIQTAGKLASAEDSVDPARKTDAVESTHPAPATEVSRRLNPLEYAQSLKTEAAARVAAAAKTVKDTEKTAAEKASDARKASAEFREADDAVREVEHELSVAMRRGERAQEEKAQNEDIVAKSASLKAGIESELAEAQNKIAEAQRDKETKEQEFAKARRAAEEARSGLKASIRAARSADSAASVKENEARRAARQLKQAEDAVKAIDERRAEAAAKYEKAQGEEAAKQAAEAATAFENKLAEARAKLDEARKIKETKDKEYADSQRVADEAETEVKKARDAEVNASSKEDEARAAARSVKAAEAAVKEMEFRIADAVRKTTKAHIELGRNEDSLKRSAEAKTELEARRVEAKKVADELQKVKEAKEKEWTDSRNAAHAAEAEAKAAAIALRDATRRIEPVSVLISRKTGRLHVRQAFQPIFDAPVTIAAPQQPLGTHLYVANQAAEDGSGLRWAAISMGPAGEVREQPRREHSRRRSARGDEPEQVQDAPRKPETASSALDRITIPEETARRIAELSWVGASVIITDHGISSETGVNTDFVILTRTRASAR